MNINDLLLDIKTKVKDVSDEELDKYTFLTTCLLELQAYHKMYEDDLVRFNSYYEECEKSYNDMVDLLKEDD